MREEDRAEEEEEEEGRNCVAPINAEMIKVFYFEHSNTFWANGAFFQLLWVTSVSRSWKTAKRSL